MAALTVLAIVLIFASVVAYMVLSERKNRLARRQAAQSLGFTPIDPPPDLQRRLSDLYAYDRGSRNAAHPVRFELQNVSTKTFPDGELFIFDLINESDSESSAAEQQAAAVLSPGLHLPHFVLIPKADIGGPITSLSNRVLTWVVAKFGDPVEFPEATEFSRRYLVSAPDPDAARQFLDANRLHRLAHTRLLAIHAAGDLFTVSTMPSSLKPLSREDLSDRINQASQLLSIFR